jgi:hypothetical protein
MLRLLADENFNGRIVRGLRQREPRLDLVTVQEAGLSGADDPTVLDWAASEGRVLLTHDAATMSAFAYARVRAGLPMPGVFEVSDRAGLGRVIEDLLDIALLSFDGEYEGQVRYVPLRRG